MKNYFKYLSFISLIAMLFLSIACQDKSELEKFQKQQGLQEQNKEIAKEVFAAIDKNDFDKLKVLLADNFVLKSPGLVEPIKRDPLFEIIKVHFTSFPDWTHKAENVLAEGNKVSLMTFEKGTHKAVYEGIAPTGKIAEMIGFHIFTIENGKVVEWWALNDDLVFMTQLGMELKPVKSKK